MIYSSACEYAIRAATYLAAQPAEDLVKVREIAEAEDIPAPFLATILQDLVGAGLLRSARGPTGGYALDRPAKEITLRHIKEVVDGLAGLEECAVGLHQCSDETPCPLHDTWQPIRRRIAAYLEETSLREMADAVAAKRASLAKGPSA